MSKGYRPSQPTTRAKRHTIQTESRDFPTFTRRSFQEGVFHTSNFLVSYNTHLLTSTFRLRTIMDQRRRPQPLSLYIEPIPKSYFSPSPTPCESESASPRPRNSLVQALLRILPHRYSQAHQLEEHEAVEYAQDGCWWREMDHRVIIMGIVGLLLLAFSLGAWAMALYTA